MADELKQYITLINQNLEALRRKFGVKKIAIFCSMARGDNKKKSDIDIIVELDKPRGFFNFIELENHLSKILGKKVDLTTKNSLKPAVKKSVLKEAVYV